MIIIFSGVHNIGALIGLWLTAFVTFVTVYEFWRAMNARHKRSGENYLAALWNLIGRNRRRYGGYIIHLSVVFMALGIIGIELFQTETQSKLAPGESVEIAGYSVTYNGLTEFDTPDGRNVARAVMSVSRKMEKIWEIFTLDAIFIMIANNR